MKQILSYGYYYLRFFFYIKLLKGKFKYVKTQITFHHSINKCLSNYYIKDINQVNTSYVKGPLLFTDLETSPSCVCSGVEVSRQTQNRLTEIYFFSMFSSFFTGTGFGGEVVKASRFDKFTFNPSKKDLK